MHDNICKRTICNILLTSKQALCNKLKVLDFFNQGHQFQPFWSQIGYDFHTLVLNWFCFFFFFSAEGGGGLGEASFSSILIKPSTIAFNHAFTWDCKVGLKKGISLRVGYQISGQVINMVGKVADFGVEQGFGKRTRHHHPHYCSGSPPGFPSNFS